MQRTTQQLLSIKFFIIFNHAENTFVILTNMVMLGKCTWACIEDYKFNLHN